jgi:hypothetical protein
MVLADVHSTLRRRRAMSKKQKGWNVNISEFGLFAVVLEMSLFAMLGSCRKSFDLINAARVPSRQHFVYYVHQVLSCRLKRITYNSHMVLFQYMLLTHAACCDMLYCTVHVQIIVIFCTVLKHLYN